MIKVLQVPTGGLVSDGIVSCIIEYMDAMDKSDMDIRVLATNNTEEKILQKIKDIGCDVVSIPDRKKNIFIYFWKLYKYIKREKIDIIHVHGSSAIMSVELVAAKIAGCHIRIAHSHNTKCDNKKLDRLFRPIFNISYTEAFACGNDAGRWMFGKKNLTVIHNARNISKYEFNYEKRMYYRKKLQIPENALVVGHVGRFNGQKNHEFLVKIFNELNKINKNTYLVLVGTGATFENIKKQVRDYGLNENVIFTGAIDNVSDYLSSFDIMLLPSLYEGLPLVVIEWQISGLPCIISDSITRECAITPLVKYESISKNPVIWVDDINTIVLQNREECKDKILNIIMNEGYNVELEAKKLKKLYYGFIKNMF